MAKDLAEARLLLAKSLRSRGVKAYESSKYTVRGFTDLTEFALSFMPGNRRTLVSHEVKVYDEHRNKGVGTQACAIRELAARDAGVTLLLATVMDSNAAEISILSHMGWKRLTQNFATMCSLWGKQLL